MAWAMEATGPPRRSSARRGHAVCASPGSNGSNTGGIVSAREWPAGTSGRATVPRLGVRRKDVFADDSLLPVQRAPAPVGTVIISQSRVTDRDHRHRVVAAVILAVALVVATVAFVAQPSHSWYPAR